MVSRLPTLLITGALRSDPDALDEGLYQRFRAAATALLLNPETEQYNRWTNEVSRGGI